MDTDGHLALYHWTPAANVPRIRQDGLRPLGRPQHVLPEAWPTLTASRQQAFDQAMAYSLSGDTYAVISYSIPNDQVETYVYLVKECPADMPWYALRDENPLPDCLITDVQEFRPSTVSTSS